MRVALAGLIRLYQVAVSPLLPRACRFYPTCSQYALEAVVRHGALHGTALAARRLARCHPWNPGGVDFVPDFKRGS
ncbi:MAG: membrane protein insertion efficiency factor YidD [Candidatus Eremiobacteraeota bacterium]|nr:membrane protein insertion efficiency factor YidD [Candidatus Eremiobacteraeota bacterium]